MLWWLLWAVLVVLAAVLAVWAALIATMVLGVSERDWCPKCGALLEIDDGERFLRAHLNPKYGSALYDYCQKCGWYRTRQT